MSHYCSRLLLLACCVSLSVSCAGVATKDSVFPTSHLALTEMQVDSGYFDKLFFRQSMDGDTVTLNVTLSDPRPIAEWGAVATVCARGAAEEDRSCLVVFAVDSGPKVLVGVRHPSGEGLIKGLEFQVGTAIRIRLKAHRHAVAWSVGGFDIPSRPTDFAIEGFQLTCSSATCRFEEEECCGDVTEYVRGLWAGTYKATSRTVRADATSPTGIVADALGVSSLERTTKISASLGTRFGIVYAFGGPVLGATVPHRLTYRLPGRGAVNPMTGNAVASYSVEKSCAVGQRCFAGYSLDEAWEIVEGQWTFEIWQGDRLRLRQFFDVTVPPVIAVIANDGLLRTLTVDDARSLIDGDGFAASADLAVARTPPVRDIVELEFQLLDQQGAVTKRSRMRFENLPRGLEHVSHVVAATAGSAEFMESFIGLYGIASALYWNSRGVQEGQMAKSTPTTLRLLSGALFPPTEVFILEHGLPEGDTATMTCRSTESVRADSLHPNLSGDAIILTCESGSTSSVYWYLVDAARFVMAEFRDQGELLSRFRIAGVTYR